MLPIASTGEYSHRKLKLLPQSGFCPGKPEWWPKLLYWGTLCVLIGDIWSVRVKHARIALAEFRYSSGQILEVIGYWTTADQSD